MIFDLLKKIRASRSSNRLMDDRDIRRYINRFSFESF